MKRSSIISLIFASAVLYIALTSSSNGRATAANSGNTGAPNESQTCSSCHSGGGFGPVSLSIQVFQQGTTTPVAGYIPGTTYDMRVTVQNSNGNPAGFGFQMTCLTTSGNIPQAGYTNLASNVKQKTITSGPYNGRTYVEHNGVLPNNQFNFSWTAPGAGTGNVTFYSAGNCVNASGSTGGDNGGSTNRVLPEVPALNAGGSFISPVCANDPTGSIDVQVAGGLTPITYSWNDGVQTQDRSGLGAGTYQVTISDAAGQEQMLSFTLTSPDPVTPNLTTIDASFFGGFGSVSYDPEGGAPPYEIEMDPAADPDHLPAGDYTLFISDDNDCIYSFPFTILSPADLELITQQEDISCFGMTDGSLSIEITGGVAPYIFQWADGDFTLERTDLPEGSYSLTVSDATGYEKTFDFFITEPEPLDIEITAGTILCNGNASTVEISAFGGTIPYSGTGVFQWPAGSQAVLVSDANGCVVTANVDIFEPDIFTVTAEASAISCTGETGQIEFEASGGTLPYQNFTESVFIANPGVYPFEFTDANGCTASLTVEVPAIDGFTIESAVSNALCFGECSGTAVLSSPNAGSAVTFEWPDDVPAAVRNDLCAGTYLITASDEHGCVLTTQIVVGEPATLDLDIISIAEEGPFTGEIEVSASGGISPYTYAWSTGAEGNITTIPVNENHFVTVTDANGCTLVSENFFIFLQVEEYEFNFTVYPNPASDYIFIDTERSFGREMKLCLSEMSGRIIEETSVESFPVRMDISHLSKGYYLLQVEMSGRKTTHRIYVR